MIKKLGLVALLFCLIANCVAQNQLVVLNGEKVIATFKEGDDLTFKLKKEEQFKTGYILKVEDFYVITNHDTVPFNRVDKISLKGKRFSTKLSTIGSAMVSIGFLYYAIDQGNSILVQKNGFDTDPAAWKPAALLAGIGLPLMLVQKKNLHVGWKYKLKSTSLGSPFYKY